MTLEIPRVLGALDQKQEQRPNIHIPYYKSQDQYVQTETSTQMFIELFLIAKK